MYSPRPYIVSSLNIRQKQQQKNYVRSSIANSSEHFRRGASIARHGRGVFVLHEHAFDPSDVCSCTGVSVHGTMLLCAPLGRRQSIDWSVRKALVSLRSFELLGAVHSYLCKTLHFYWYLERYFLSLQRVWNAWKFPFERLTRFRIFLATKNVLLLQHFHYEFLC